jgi:flavin-dependent dehydrogenase
LRSTAVSSLITDEDVIRNIAAARVTIDRSLQQIPERSNDGMNSERYDVLILGSGLAGLCLARQLLLQSDKTVLLVDRRPMPPPRQKVGEATVQMSGYYYGKVLDLEEYLLQEHYLKYNLRFYWPGKGAGERYEELSQSYIRGLSNIPTYQLDRNKFEAEVLRRNQEFPNFRFEPSARGLELDLGKDGAPHAFRFRTPEGELVAGEAGWVVDASGRNRVLQKKLGLARRSPIRHATTFAWVDGLLDIERLTDLAHRERRLRPDRAALGHFPPFLATNHFCGEGFWFWVIPLHGRTSLGLVYDVTCVPFAEVSSGPKMVDWICRRYPLLARALAGREVIDASGFADFAHDCAQTLSADRWALCGEACRFTDPLYSPGGDLISLYNTLITDAILTQDPERLPGKVRLYESLARSLYEAYVPSYAVSYQTLGDQEAFTLRYVWELAVYFSFYVFPFVNDLFTDPTFGTGFLRRFARLGPINRGLHELLVNFYYWKRDRGEAGRSANGEAVYFDFYEVPALKAAETCFYKVGVGSEEARRVLDEQLDNLEDLARWIYAHVASVATGDARALSRPFVHGIDVSRLAFDPAQMAERVAAVPPAASAYSWKLPPPCMARFRPVHREEAAASPVAPETAAARLEVGAR